jgi:metal-responsive CopG/Arc/MetJ family transcriptional regulator
MTEVQILFRVDEELLEDLDDTIKRSGFRTRNEWFRNAARAFMEDAERKSLLRKLSKLKDEGATEKDAAEMVRKWRKGAR